MEAIRSPFQNSSIPSCVTLVGATQTASGIIHHIKSENTEIGQFPNLLLSPVVDKARLDGFTALLTEGRTVFVVEDNIQTKRWEKVVWNVAWNSITSLTMVDTQSWLHSCPNAIPMAKELMEEVIEVTRKSGVLMRAGLVDYFFKRIMALPGVISSMQKDVKARNSLEIDVILGVPVRKARELEVKTPILEVIYALVAGIDYGLREGKMFG